MKDVEKECQHEHVRAWNMPLLACSRTLSHTGSAGHSPSPHHGLDQPSSTLNSAPCSWEDSWVRCPVSWSIAKLLRKERRTMNMNIIGGHRIQDGSPASSTSFTNSWIICFAPVDSKHSLKWFRKAPLAYSQPILNTFWGLLWPSSPTDLTCQWKDAHSSVKIIALLVPRHVQMVLKLGLPNGRPNICTCGSGWPTQSWIHKLEIWGTNSRQYEI